MQIICPECKFARKVDESKIPARSQVATCPKCQTKFKFRDLPEQEFEIEEPTPEPVGAGPEPKAEPQQEPILKPFTQEAPVQPEPEPEPVQAPEPEKKTFPGIPKPDADAKGGLWDRLDSMTPPEATPEPEEKKPRLEAKITRKPPVIGAKYGQPEKSSQPDDLPREQPQGQQPVPGWNGEFNEDFPDPMDYQEDGDDHGDDEHGMKVPPPFEQLDRYGFFSGLFMTIKLVMFSPRLFFSVMPVGNGVAKPLTFAILVALIQTLAQFAWGVAGLTPGMEVTSGGVVPVDYNITNGMFELLLTPAFAAITLYIFTGFYHLILSILRAGDQGFEGSFRALAYAYAPMITGIIPMPTIEIMAGWMFVYAAWSLVLTAIGFKHIHKISYLKAIPALLMPVLIGMILALLMAQGQFPTV